MATKTKSYGFQFAYSANGSSYTTLTDMAGITLPSIESADVDVSHLESAQAYKEYLGGWKEPGEIEFMGYFTKTQFNALLALLGNSDGYFWKGTFPLISGESTNSTFVIRGHLKKVSFDEINTDEGGRIMCPFSMKCSGPPTFTAGT